MHSTETRTNRDRWASFVDRLRNAQDYWWVATIAAAYLYLFVRVQWRIGDEGDMLNGALAVVEGRVPYRDFNDLRGPLSFYWLGLFFKLFGASWRVARIQLLLTGTLTSVLTYHLTRRVGRGAAVFLPCAFVTVLSIPSWAAPHHHWDSNLFALSATVAFFYWEDHREWPALLTTGLLAGLTSCFIYQKGFLLLLSFLVVLTISRKYFRADFKLTRAIGLVLGGYILVGLVVLAWFARLGALRDFVDATIRNPVSTYVDANRLPYAYHLTLNALGVGPLHLFPPAFTLANAIGLIVPFLLVAALPVLVASILAARVLTEPPTKVLQLPVVAYTVVGFGLWFSEFHRRDIMHLIYGSPLLFVALWVVWDSVGHRALVKKLMPAIVAVPLVFVATNKGLYAAAARTEIMTRRGPIVLPQDDAALRFLLSGEVTRGEYLLVYPYYPAYYFLADIRNPTRFGEMMYGPGSRPYFDEAIAAIEAKKVKYVLWDTLVAGENLREWFPAYQVPPKNEQWMELYFEEHYEQISELNGFRLLKRRP
jgi:hypothetical protein